MATLNIGHDMMITYYDESNWKMRY